MDGVGREHRGSEAKAWGLEQQGHEMHVVGRKHRGRGDHALRVLYIRRENGVKASCV